jgi:AMMECR1 domain-containing protein
VIARPLRQLRASIRPGPGGPRSFGRAALSLLGWMGLLVLGWTLLAVLALAVLVAWDVAIAHEPSSSLPALAPYRDFARTPDAVRLLATARSAMESHWALDDSARATPPIAAGETVPVIAWPGPPVTVFVSLSRDGATRACVGRTVSAPTLSGAVAGLAVEALEADPRRPPVRREELARLRLLISFAGEGETLSDPMLADPAREGLSITTGHGSVAFLPGEARTVSWALREARRVGVLDKTAGPATYRRFPVVVISEPRPPAGSEEPDATP